MLSRQEGVLQTAQGIAFVFVCPFLMLEPALPDRAALGAALATGALAGAACGAAYISRSNYPLEASL